MNCNNLREENYHPIMWMLSLTLFLLLLLRGSPDPRALRIAILDRAGLFIRGSRFVAMLVLFVLKGGFQTREVSNRMQSNKGKTLYTFVKGIWMSKSLAHVCFYFMMSLM